MMDLSIIIVNYKSSQHVLNCLHSIDECRMQIKYEIIVVDNASNDGSKELILSIHEGVIWIQSEYNAGFARANNVGIRAARGRNVLLLNADTIIKNNAIEQTVTLFDKNKQFSACGVQLLNPDGSKQLSGAKFIRGGVNNFLALPYIGDFLRIIGYRSGMKQHNVVDLDKDEQVDWIVGAFLMTRRTVIDMAGLLDEDFFMYAEEIEWCSRIRQYGPMILYHQPTVIHIGGGTSSSYYNKESNENFSSIHDQKGKQIVLSQWLRIRKQYGLIWYAIHLITYYFAIVFFGICVTIDKLIRGRKSIHDYSQWLGYSKNLIKLSKFIPSIAINKHQFYKA
ncbi:MAG: glycosyltransferase family 2 protein [bacterium]|jgi:GT2 family glycosyltransferase